MNFKISYYDINDNLVLNYKIYIYDSSHKLIYKNNTNNGFLFVNLNKYGLYKIIIKTKTSFAPRSFSTYLFFHKNIDKILPIHLNNHKINPSIKFDLFDTFYNMPIERGEIYLWQNNIQ